ncbi:hypothetical protein [Halosolutus gelatinilyticus]|uniref:hypothetical protein n=1 Tax=Halosolutus gelatinilyticus TaxID=2931975 RepID=UPI001FF1E8C5|nr:hypothetical protein [Halosolutus gelatinilyticus]
MSSQHSFIDDVGLRDTGFALAWLLALVFLIPIQLASMIGFDETGLDTLSPDFVFMAVVPALILTLFPTLVARHLYTRGTTRIIAIVAFVVFTAVAAYTSQFYGLCGPNC